MSVIVEDMAVTKKWKDKLRLLYKPINWRPADARKRVKTPRVYDDLYGANKVANKAIIGP